jgi:hypothetical protein
MVKAIPTSRGPCSDLFPSPPLYSLKTTVASNSPNRPAPVLEMCCAMADCLKQSRIFV